MNQYVNMHQHTIYSMLDGHAKPLLLAKRAAELGMPALAFTDHGNIHGWLDFYDSCNKVGIKPILGLEAYQARKTRFDRDEEERAGQASDELLQRGPYHLTILAKNEVGYKNLIKLSSRSYLEGYYVKPRIDHDLLAQHSEGLIVLSGCLNGEVQQALLRDDIDSAFNAAAKLQEIVGRDNFFLEMMDHDISEQQYVLPGLLAIGKFLNAPFVPTGDCHYIHKEDAFNHDVMLCVSTKARVTDEKRFKFHNDEFYLKSNEEMEAIFPREWLDNTLRITDQVELKLSFNELYFPEFTVPTNETIDEYLERLVWAGAVQRYGSPLPQQVEDRIIHELGVVKRMGFQSYFLVVSDLVNWAKNNGIRVGWGRGSAAGSILSYVLRITGLEPLKFGLLFERFLVEGRKSMPDIDLDFDSRYRDKVIEYARQKYGDDRVAHICNFSGVGAKAAIKDAGRVLGYEFSVTNSVGKLIPPPVLGISKTIEQALQVSSVQDAYQKNADIKKIMDAAKGLEGLIRQTGVHAAGIVIAQAPISDFVPVMQKTTKNGGVTPVTTQWAFEDIERCGLLKIDFLAIKNLDIIDMCIEFVEQARGVSVDLDTIPLDDEATYKELQAGNTMGVFQLESLGMKEMTLAMQPSCLEDIMAIISLYRPGPMGSGMDKTYVARKHGREEVSYEHPKLADVLDTTYGLMMYQEDVLAVARVLAGFSVPEADDLRKAIGKKEVDKIGLFRAKFVEGCVKTSDVPENLADKIFSDVEFFGGYGFNRAHGAAYAMLSYVTAYLKTNYPAEYMAALLSSAKKEKAAPYLNECRRMGVKVYPPSINISGSEFKVLSDNEILFGLSSISGMGPALVDSIINNRTEPYTTVPDFMRRCSLEILNKTAIEHLIRSGALDELIPLQPNKLISRTEKMNILDLEKAELGLYISDHPLLDVWHILEHSINSTVVDLSDRSTGENVTVAGMVTGFDKRLTRKNEVMYNFFIEDLTGEIEVMAFPKEAAKCSFRDGDIIILDARTTKDDEEHGNMKLIYSTSARPPISEFELGEPITLKFPEIPSNGILEEIEMLIESTPGDSPVYVEFHQNNHLLSMRFKKPTSIGIKETLELLTLKERLCI